MFVKYTPAGQPTQDFTFDPGRVKLSVAAQIEFRYSKLLDDKNRSSHYQQFVMDLKQGSAVARRVLLHHLLRLQHPTIRIEDVDPFEGEVVVTMNRQELLELRASIEKAGNLTVGERETILAQLDAEIADAADGDESGKADGSSTTGPDL